uniref:Uncharacterized protein n=1 Tax=viral metagenome TaxID=1070528 RepID=A0A6C0KNY7_9ZZZZ
MKKLISYYMINMKTHYGFSESKKTNQRRMV